MLVLVWLLSLMMKMKMMKTASAETITAPSGGAVLLPSHQQVLNSRQDVRWTHPRLVMSLKANVTTCHHGRCELLSDGSLRFNRVQTADAGSYRLEVFDEHGSVLKKSDFLLRVEDTSSSMVSVLVCCFLLFLLLLFIIIFFLKRKRSQSMRTAGPLEENVYVVMHRHHGDKRKDDDDEKHESNNVYCNSVVSMEKPIPEQTSVDEDVYV